MKKLLLSLTMAMSLSACAYQGVPTLEKTDFVGGGFSTLLAGEYKKYAMFEAYKMADWSDAEYFADKALAAGNGESVMPSELSERSLPDFSVADLTDARGKLLHVLNSKNEEKNWGLLAKAQSSFDCWMEQQEENIQPDDIAECRVQFERAMAELTKPEPVVVVEETFRVFFDHDSAKLNDDALATLGAAKVFIGDKMGARIVVTGNADTSGSAAYNEALAQKRADAVYAALIETGIPEHKVEIVGKGEGNLLVATDDNVKEAKNRRVDIFIVR